jgi:hypothetical protein
VGESVHDAGEGSRRGRGGARRMDTWWRPEAEAEAVVEMANMENRGW